LAKMLRKYIRYLGQDSKLKNNEFKEVCLFWFPLFTTWLLMGLENPTTSSLVARLDNAKENLAAFGVAFAVGLLVESPIINLLSAVAAKCRDVSTYILLRKFAMSLNFAVLFIHCIILLPPVFDLIFLDLVGLTDNVASLTHEALCYLILWPPLVGVRRFYQGVMVADGKTKKIAYGTSLRLFTVGCLVFYFVYIKILNGAAAGCLTLSIAVTVEAIYIYVASKPSQRKFLSIKKSAADQLNLRELVSYYSPLAQTSMLGLAFQPVLTFFLARSVNPVESLAAFPVANGFVFMFRTVGLSVTEVYLVFMERNKEYLLALKKLTAVLIVSCLLLYAFLAFTGGAKYIVTNALGLDVALSEITTNAIKVFTPLVAGTILLSYYRAQVMLWSKTIYLSRGTAIEISLVLILVWIFVDFLSWDGAFSAALALVLARFVQIGYVYKMLRKEKKLA